MVSNVAPLGAQNFKFLDRGVRLRVLSHVIPLSLNHLPSPLRPSRSSPASPAVDSVRLAAGTPQVLGAPSNEGGAGAPKSQPGVVSRLEVNVQGCKRAQTCLNFLMYRSDL